MVADLTLAAAGGLAGGLAGLVPGLHPNTVATGILVGGLTGWIAPQQAPPLLLGSLGAWTFASVVPLVVLGVPEGEDAPALLPGQRLARRGEADVALAASARGSMIGLFAGSLAALAIAWAGAHVDVEPALQAATPWVQGLALLVLVASDPAGPLRSGSVATIAGVLGVVALDVPLSSPLGLPATPLAPLFIGLFGLPALAHAAQAGAPRQEHRARQPERGQGSRWLPGLLGSGLGLAAGTVAGLTSGPATAIAATVRSGRADEILATTSAVNTSAACVATAMLHLAGRTRMGVHAVQLALAPPTGMLGALVGDLSYMALGAVVGLGVLVVANRYAATLATRVPQVAPVLVAVWIALVAIRGGAVGFLIALAAWSAARAASALGTRRSMLMASLLVPGLLDAIG